MLYYNHINVEIVMKPVKNAMGPMTMIVLNVQLILLLKMVIVNKNN